MELQNQYMLVVKSLKLLASTYEDKKELLPSFVDIPHEVISLFEDAFLILPQLIEAGMLTDISIASILRLYNKLQWYLNNIELDNFSDKEWDTLRELSKNVLLTLNIN